MAKLFGGYKFIFLCESHSHKFSKCPGWVRYELCWYFSFHYLEQIFLWIYMFKIFSWLLGQKYIFIHTCFRFSTHLICYYHHAVLRFLLQNGNNPKLLWMSLSLSCLSYSSFFSFYERAAKKNILKTLNSCCTFSNPPTFAEKLSSVRMCVLQKEIYFEWHFYGGTIFHVVAFFMVAFCELVEIVLGLSS